MLFRSSGAALAVVDRDCNPAALQAVQDGRCRVRILLDDPMPGWVDCAAALRAVPRELLDAGTALGTRPWRVFLRLHVPLARRGIAAGLTLGFAHTLGEFGVVLMIGGSVPGKTRVASIALYDEVQALAYPRAHAFAAVLLALSFVLLLGVTLLQRRRGPA